MGTDEIFGILEIEPTKDEGKIKQAYRNKLSRTNPEDDPSGFKRLRQAYEDACAYARSTEPDAEETRDTSPSGLWVERAAEIYGNMTRRRDLGEWKQLFEDELFLSLDGEEECREKLLVFMMNHIYFPTDVWKLLDERLGIRSGFARLREKFPVDFLNYLVHKCSRGEDVDFELFRGAPDADYDLFLQKYNQAWRALENDDVRLARQMLSEMEGLGIEHPLTELLRSSILVEEKDMPGAVECLARAYGKYPGDMTTAFNYGQLLWKSDEMDAAAEIFLKIKADTDDHYMSNYYLSQWYYGKGDYRTAKKCAEKVMAVGSGDEFYELTGKINSQLEKEYITKYTQEDDIESAIELSWCYLQDGKFFQGIKLARGLEGKLPDGEVLAYHGLLAKLYLEEAEYEECLVHTEIWRRGLRDKIKSETGSELDDDINRLYQTYVIRTNAYHMMGFQRKECFESAVAEVEAYEALDKELKTQWVKGVSIFLEKAQVLLDMDKADECIEYCTWLLEEKQLYSASAILVDAYARKLDAGGVVNAGRECMGHFPQYPRAYEQVAKVFLDLEYKEELDKLLAEAADNGVESQILDAYGYLSDKQAADTSGIRESLDEFEKKYKTPLLERHDTRFYEEGYPELTRLLHEYPSNYMLVERGRFSMDAKDYDSAMRDFHKVLERRTDEQFALNNLGCIYKYTGEYEKALVCFKKAIRYMDEEPNVHPYANLAHTYERMGEYGLAVTAYESAINRFEDHGMWDDLAVDYARSGQADRAKAVVDEQKGNYIGTIDEYMYFNDLHDVYLYADDLQSLAGNLERERKSFVHIIDKKKRERAMNSYYLRKGKLDVVNGDYSRGLDELRKAASTLGQDGNGCEADYVLGTMIIVLTLHEYAKNRGCVKKRGLRTMFHAGDGNIKEELEKCADGLEKELRPGSMDWNRDPYFYYEKQRCWNEFLVAFARDAAPDLLEGIIERMDGCHMCRSCEFPSCNELGIARGMLLERQGRLTEAIGVYEAVQKEQPFEWYSKMRLRYLADVDWN